MDNNLNNINPCVPVDFIPLPALPGSRLWEYLERRHIPHQALVEEEDVIHIPFLVEATFSRLYGGEKPEAERAARIETLQFLQKGIWQPSTNPNRQDVVGEHGEEMGHLSFKEPHFERVIAQCLKLDGCSISQPILIGLCLGGGSNKARQLNNCILSYMAVVSYNAHQYYLQRDARDNLVALWPVKRMISLEEQQDAQKKGLEVNAYGGLVGCNDPKTLLIPSYVTGILINVHDYLKIIIEGPRFSIETDAFACQDSSNIEEVVLPDGLKQIGDRAFYHCTKLERINFPDALISVGKEAFLFTRLKTIILGPNIEYIGDDALGSKDVQCTVFRNFYLPSRNLIESFRLGQTVAFPKGYPHFDKIRKILSKISMHQWADLVEYEDNPKDASYWASMPEYTLVKHC